LGTAVFAVVKETAGLITHQVGGLGVDVGTGNGELHALVLADGAIKDDPFAGVLGHLVNKPIGITNTFGGTQCALGVESIEDITEAHALFANAVFNGDFQIFEKKLIGLVVDHVGNGL